jgi:hypothetical protein
MDGKPYSPDLRMRVVAAIKGGPMRPAALRRARWAVTSRRQLRETKRSGCRNRSRAVDGVAPAGLWLLTLPD